MAREAMVTRTIISTQVTVLGVDEVAGEATNATYNLPGVYTDKAKALKAAIKANAVETYHPSVVEDMKKEERVLGIPVSKFMELAVEVERPKSQQKKEA
jgi:hypothetical protein